MKQLISVAVISICILTACSDSSIISDETFEINNTSTATCNETTVIIQPSIATETLPADPVEEGSNFLGGSGSLKTFNSNPFILYDDENIYNGNAGSYHKKSIDEGGTWRYVCRTPGCKHESKDCLLNRYFLNSSHLFAGDGGLLLASKGVVSQISDNGSCTQMVNFSTEYQEMKLQPETVTFQSLIQLTNDLLFFDFDAQTEEEFTIRKYGFYDMKKNKRTILTDDTAPFCIADRYDSDVVWLFSADYTPYRLSLNSSERDADYNECPDHAMVDLCYSIDGVLYYVNYLNQYCAFDSANGTKTLLAAEAPFITFIESNRKIWGISLDGKSIFCANPDLTEQKTVVSDSEDEIISILYADEKTIEYGTAYGSIAVDLTSGRSVSFK